MKTLTQVETILKYIFEEYNAGFMDWLHLALNRDQLWALVDMIMNLRVP
jgi:hypothetical protein